MQGDDVPLMRPVLPGPEKTAGRFAAMHRSGWFTNFGPQSRELEARLATRLQVAPDQVVCVSNATVGLVGALVTSPAKRWSLPSWTFTATAAAAVHAGCDAVFSDVDEEDWWLRASASELEGVLRVAPFGVGFGVEAWSGPGEVVIDAAASLGADHCLAGLPETAAVVYSLGATKVLGAGEGGAVVLGDPDRAARLRAWTNFGFADDRRSIVPGLNAKLSEPAAVMALAALDGWDEERDEWLSARHIADELTAAHGLRGGPGLGGQVSPYWIVQLPDSQTRALYERVLARHRIGTRRWWGQGCHRMPAYHRIARPPLPVTERLAGTVLGLPMFRRLSAVDAGRIDLALEEARAVSAGALHG